MSSNASRLTLYGLISAIEQDLRLIIAVHLAPQFTTQKLFGEELYTKAFERYQREEGQVPDSPPLDRMLTYLDYADTIALLNRHRSLLPANIGRYFKGMTPVLNKLVPVRNRVAHTRPLLPDDPEETFNVARRLLTEQSVHWPQLQSVYEELQKNPSFVLALEMPAYVAEEEKTHNLPIPEFDETGFVGREQFIKTLKQACLGPFPVISIVGEGGIGKTATALKVSYEILDDPKSPFDAIVWTTSKTSRLTPNDIVAIEGAIKDSLGLFSNVVGTLAGDGVEVDDAVAEVLSYLAEFKILLVVDNLETVLDSNVVEFLGQLPAGSKVLLTSRIGLGELEYRVKLEPLDGSEAVQLMRATARARGVAGLVQTSNSQLQKYCERLKNNPGYIRWFVSVVQTGVRAEEALSNGGIFLRFCLANVYDYLTDGARDVIKAQLSVPGRHNLAELAYLTKMEPEDLLSTVYQLQRTNMVSVSTAPFGSSYETRYELSDLAREYLFQEHPVPTDEYKVYQKRTRQLVALKEEMGGVGRTNRFHFKDLTLRSSGDAVAAKYLTDALKSLQRKRIPEAAESLGRARDLAPDYFEVRRIAAYVLAHQGNIAAAEHEFEAAVALEPDNAVLLYHFGEFYFRFLDDSQSALERFSQAADIDGTSMEIQLNLARAHLYLQHFHEAKTVLDRIMKMEAFMALGDRKVYDLLLQVYSRSAEYFVSKAEPVEGLKQLEALQTTYESLPVHLLDWRMKEVLRKSLPTARHCAQLLRADHRVEDGNHIVDWLLFELSEEAPNTFNRAPGDDVFGRVGRVVEQRGYGFIDGNDGTNYFFHRSDVVPQEVWDTLKVGDNVAFEATSAKKGPRATSVRVIVAI